MAINKNHEFEELDGIKCGIVEKNVSPERVEFLQQLLDFNGFTVIAVPSPATKAAPTPAAKEGEEAGKEWMNIVGKKNIEELNAVLAETAVPYFDKIK